MTINNADQLIIIGNGFDLHCGLKTSFKDYFTFKKKEILRKLISIGKEPLEDLDSEELDNLYDKSTLNKLNYNLHYANDEIINSDFISSDFGIKEKFEELKKLDFSFLSFWDVYFINLRDKKENWADVELNVAEYLKNDVNKSFSYIEELDGNTPLSEVHNISDKAEINDILVYFMLLTNDMEKIRGLNLKKFLCYLKDQLIDFEKNINDYILSLFIDDNPIVLIPMMDHLLNN